MVVFSAHLNAAITDSERLRACFYLRLLPDGGRLLTADGRSAAGPAAAR
jgi:hypothetical protein